MVERSASASSTAAPATHGTVGKDHHEVVLRHLPSEMADFRKNAVMTSCAKPFQALHFTCLLPLIVHLNTILQPLVLIIATLRDNVILEYVRFTRESRPFNNILLYSIQKAQPSRSWASQYSPLSLAWLCLVLQLHRSICT